MQHIKHQKDKIIVDGRLLSNKPTGISRYTKELIHGLSEHFGKENVSVVVNQGYSNVESYNIIQTRLKPYNPFHYLLFSIFINFQIYSLYYSPFYSGLYFKLRRRKQIVTVHDLMYLRIKNYFSDSVFKNSTYNFIFNFIVRSTLNTSNLIISVSDTTKKDIIELFKKESLVIGEGVNEFTKSELQKDEFHRDEFHEFGRISRNTLEGIEKEGYFLYVGNFRRQKNIPFLIEAFKRSETPHKMVLVGDTNCTNYYELHKSVHDKPEDILFTGVLEDNEINDLYQNCLAFIMPSFYEGFGMPILEAYCSGARVFSSDQGALKEFKDLSIHYFSPSNLDELVYLMRNVENFSKPGESEIIEAKKVYCWPNQMQKIMDVVENLYHGR